MHFMFVLTLTRYYQVNQQPPIWQMYTEIVQFDQLHWTLHVTKEGQLQIPIVAWCGLWIQSGIKSQKNIHAQSNTLSLPSMAQLGWALLFLLGSWSSVEEGLPLPRTGSLPWVPPLPGVEVAELLQGSPPSVRNALHSGPPTNSR